METLARRQPRHRHGATSGLVVLDIDLPNGPASLARLTADHGPLPATCEQRTGSGGRQLRFAHPGHPLGNRTRVEPGIEVRGDGGYIVAPPSLHASGARYRWTGRVPAAPAPVCLLELLDRTRTTDVAAAKAPTQLPPGTREQRYAASALHREIARVASAVEGSRNDSLNRAAFNLGQLAASGLLSPDDIAAQLEQAAVSTGLPTAEARRTITSGLSAGLTHPRTAPAASLAGQTYHRWRNQFGGMDVLRPAIDHESDLGSLVIGSAEPVCQAHPVCPTACALRRQRSGWPRRRSRNGRDSCHGCWKRFSAATDEPGPHRRGGARRVG